MADFADRFEIKIGSETVRGRRLTVGEIRDNLDAMAGGKMDVAKSAEIIRRHCTTDDGKPLDAYQLSIDQLNAVISAMTLPKEGRGISDFIGLLCGGQSAGT